MPEKLNVLPTEELFDPDAMLGGKKPKKVYLWDPSTMQKLGERDIMGKRDVDTTVKRGEGGRGLGQVVLRGPAARAADAAAVRAGEPGDHRARVGARLGEDARGRHDW